MLQNHTELLSEMKSRDINTAQIDLYEPIRKTSTLSCWRFIYYGIARRLLKGIGTARSTSNLQKYSRNFPSMDGYVIQNIRLHQAGANLLSESQIFCSNNGIHLEAYPPCDRRIIFQLKDLYKNIGLILEQIYLLTIYCTICGQNLCLFLRIQSKTINNNVHIQQWDPNKGIDSSNLLKFSTTRLA